MPSMTFGYVIFVPLKQRRAGSLAFQSALHRVCFVNVRLTLIAVVNSLLNSDASVQQAGLDLTRHNKAKKYCPRST